MVCKFTLGIFIRCCRVRSDLGQVGRVMGLVREHVILNIGLIF